MTKTKKSDLVGVCEKQHATWCNLKLLALVLFAFRKKIYQKCTFYQGLCLKGNPWFDATFRRVTDTLSQ